jgi:glycosyltransferase involved in cell wall biosynthesis
MKISAYIIAFNESKNIKDCINSLSFCDEIVVIDSNSSDDTCLIAKKMGAKIIEQPFLGFGAQKQFGSSMCKYNWVLNLDGDERISKELKKSILEIKNNKQHNKHIKAYKMCRANFIGTTQIKHSGWYKDIKIRLFDKRVFGWNNALVHEKIFSLNTKYKISKIPLINKDILHYAYKNIQHYTQTMDKYSSLGSKTLFNNLQEKLKKENQINIFLQKKNISIY